jgi:2'-5' RNA ligase
VEGLISLLDPVHDALIRALWIELETTLGLRGVWVTPFPHFSYQIAPAYDAPAIEAAARALAGAATPFVVQTSGLALFTSPVPVLYLPIVRTAALSDWHARVWQAALPAARNPIAHYHPDHWVPHITLAHGDLTPALAAEAVRLLTGRNFNWTIPIDNLSFIGMASGVQTLLGRHPFQPGGPNITPP